MSRVDELIGEINKVQKEINNANTLIKEEPTHLGEKYSKMINENRTFLAAKAANGFSKAVQSGDFREMIGGVVVLGGAWVGANAIDYVAGRISEAKAKKILLGLYDELAVKQNMLIEELRGMIEAVTAEERKQGDELAAAKDQLRHLTDQIKRINDVLRERTV